MTLISCINITLVINWHLFILILILNDIDSSLKFSHTVTIYQPSIESLIYSYDF